ncbi:AfsR/SARP family transcriptional regulator [Streptomyces sp. NPDC050560]|uniref:AfsR/SARP family transcriptional regulator n=1 Tax=Streptomyces sp. NPDC050560 TaxID=3365630 RepID=UPI00379ABD88
MAHGVVSFRLLGPVGMSVEGRWLPLTGKQRALLGALLLQANRVVSVERITDRLWGERPPVSAGARVRALVAELRRACGPRAQDLIATRSPGYLLRVGDAELDASVFLRQVALARRAAAEERPQDALHHYDLALAQWYGTPYDGLLWPDADAEASRLAEHRLAAREGRAEAMLALGRPAEAVPELIGLAAARPPRERAHELLMVALHGSGRVGEALEVYRGFRAALVGELGVEPSRRLRGLHQRMLAGVPERAPVRAPEPAPREARRPASPGRAAVILPAVAPAPDTPVPRQLPAAPGGFVGREAELDLLDAVTADRDRPVVVVGRAGAGKTALVTRWAHRAAARFRDGQLFLAMRGFDAEGRMEPAEALPLLLEALGRPPKDIPGDLAAQAALYRSLLAERSVLLVFDNVASADQVRPLLPGGPGCLAVVTSRDRLGGLLAREGAARVTVGTLGERESLRLLARAAGEHRVRAEPAAAAELAARCGHLPLALAVAAARLADRPAHRVGDLLAELAGRGPLSGLRVAGDETTAVRHALALSYRALAPQARRVFRLLALAPSGGVGVRAAAALAGTGTAAAADLLDELARVHLVAEGPAGRFSCHDLLYEYAAERTAAEDGAAERAAAVARLQAYYLYSAAAAVAVCRWHVLVPPPGQGPASAHPESFAGRGAALAWLDANWPEITAAVSLPGILDGRPMAWLLVCVLQDYLHHHRPLAEWRRLAGTALDAARGADDSQGVAVVRLSLGNANWRLGRLQDARREFAAALGAARRAGFVLGEADALRGEGVALKQLGRPRAALGRYRASIGLDHRLGNVRGEAAGLNNLASALLTLGRLGQAEECLTRCLPLAERECNDNMVTIALVNLGLVRQEQGRLAEAADCLGRALGVARAAGVPYGVAVALETAGRVHLDAGRWAEAAETYGEGLRTARQVENLNCQVDTLVGLADAHTGLGDPARARGLLAEAEDIVERTGHTAGRVELLVALTTAELGLGHTENAAEAVAEALVLAADGNPLAVARALTARAEVCLARGAAPRAALAARDALRVSRRTGQWLVHAGALVPLGRARRLAGDESGARASFGRAHRYFVRLGVPRQEETARLLAPVRTAGRDA